jgi:hypothetical protein
LTDWKKGGRRVHDDATCRRKGLETSYDVAQDERQDGKKPGDQGVLDQVLTPIVTDETTRNRPRHVLLGAEFRWYVEEIIKASASGGVSQNVRDYQISRTNVTGLADK